jgi:hypothetical protein
MSDKVNNTSPPTAQASPPSIIIKLTERALVSVQHEAEARNVTVEKLALAALADFLGRNAKTNAPRVHPLVLHFPEKLRSRVVSTAATHGMSVNRFVVETMAERLHFKLWKRHAPAVEDVKADEIEAHEIEEAAR